MTLRVEIKQRKMKSEEAVIKIKEAHQRYIDWWLPIDVSSGSLMAPMSCHRFCESLLVNDFGFGGSSPIENWWDEWMTEFTSPIDRLRMKSLILKLIVSHYTGLVDLNK